MVHCDNQEEVKKFFTKITTETVDQNRVGRFDGEQQRDSQLLIEGLEMLHGLSISSSIL